MSKRKKRKKPLGEYKWVQDMVDAITAEPKEEQYQAVFDFMLKKAKEEKEDGSGQS